LASTNTFYGCQVEGICIALDPELPCSWGRGNISREKIQKFINFLNETVSMNAAYTIGNREYAEKEIAEAKGYWSLPVTSPPPDCTTPLPIGISCLNTNGFARRKERM
jgi:hypothetical protein